MSEDDLQHPVLDEDEEFGVEPEAIRKLKPDLGEDWEVDTSLDTTEVRLDDPDSWTTVRPEPAWVIRGGEYLDEELGVIKTGKEADVLLVRRTAGLRECLVAHKRYRPRAQRAFRREEDYRDGQSLGDDRVDRAVRRRSRYGRAVLEYAWAYREYPIMRAAWDAGVRVPYPVEDVPDGLILEYLGDDDRAAPRLAEVRLQPREALDAFEDLVEGMRRLLDAGLVHADLSAFNVLWWQDKPWIIDFPQAVDVAKHPRGLEFLRRDCENVTRWFRRHGVACDGPTLFDKLLRDAPFATPADVMPAMPPPQVPMSKRARRRTPAK